MENPPAVLYKYFGPERIDVLRTCLIRYSPLSAFNDPFEGRPEVTALATPARMQELFNAIVIEECKLAYEQLPEDIRAVTPYELLEAFFVQQYKSKESEIHKRMNDSVPLVQELIIKGFDEGLGAFCLSEVPDSLLMWSHYGASHSGFVLEFDARDSHFNETRGTKDELRHLRRVMYRENRPSAALADFEGADVFLVKSGHWGYEREWRIFRALPEAELVISEKPFDIHLFRFPPRALKAVIVGARASDETRRLISLAIHTNENFSHVKIKSARADDSHFILKISDDHS